MAKQSKTTNRAEATSLDESDLAHLRSLRADRETSNEVFEEATRALEESDVFKEKQRAELEFAQDNKAYQQAEGAMRHRYRMHPKDVIDLETGAIRRVDPAEAYQAGQVDAVKRVRELQARQAQRRASQ